MKSLYSKYIDNQLTDADLEALRKENPQNSSVEIEEAMRNTWNSDEDYSYISDEVVSRIKRKLDKAIDNKQHVTIPVFYKVFGWAAAILLPLFLFSTIYLYKENAKVVSEEMVVATATGEKATITLPDGTLVTLNSNSRLSYIPKMYNKDNRKISFSGEAYFNVSKNEKCPFTIDSKGLIVEVLGTKFNLLVRREDKNAELFLESGEVMFTSLLKKESVILSPNEKLIMNQMNGEISIEKEIDNISSAWRHNEMIFHNTPFEVVVKNIERAYGVHIKLDYKSDSTDVFTGTLVTNDLNSVLEVIETTNNIRAVKADSGVLIILTDRPK